MNLREFIDECDSALSDIELNRQFWVARRIGLKAMRAECTHVFSIPTEHGMICEMCGINEAYARGNEIGYF